MSRANRPEESTSPLTTLHTPPQLWASDDSSVELFEHNPGEASQLLTEVALDKRIMMRSSIQSWNEINNGHMPVKTNDWRLKLFNIW